MIVTGFGSVEEHAGVLDRIRSEVPPLFEFASPMPYVALQQLLDEAKLDLAVLDYNLGAENSESIAEALKNRGIPFLFATGYGSGLDAARYAKVPIVTKPYGRGEIATAVRELDGAG